MDYQLTKNVQDPAIETLRLWIAQPSVLDEEATDTPFGRDIVDMLELALKTCEQLGMTTYRDPDNYYGYAEIGEGEETLAILCHVDVVPADEADGWTSPPFKLDIREGGLYGRGTQDDKGPTIASLYAIKALVDAGYQFTKKIRVIFGTDEETLWRCMERYNAKEDLAPIYGFAPDADFPLTYAEKGLLQVKLHGPGSDELSLKAGGAMNVVPNVAAYQGAKSDEVKASLEALGYDFEVVDGMIKVQGKSVHSKDAMKGVNAVMRLAEALKANFDHSLLNFLVENVSDVHGEKLFGDLRDEMSGPLTINLAQLEITPEKSVAGLDFRIPVTVDKDELVDKFKTSAQAFNLAYEQFDYLRSLYVPKDHELVQTLLKVYRDLTGDMTEPLSSGGATFARTMDNCVAFGAKFLDVKDTMHQVDECMPVDNFMQAMEIYAHAIKALAFK